jgi:2,4-dienoyl-CoA reductase-like NADH-dependent reductase (Old Yellow Enzyme family)
MFKPIILSILLIVQIYSIVQKKDLFDETQFKYLKLRNRVFRAPVIDCESWVNGRLTDAFYRRYEELSKNEVGTIITGQMLISDDKEYENMVRINKDEYIEDFKKLTDLVHKNGANIIAQIGPFGKTDITKDKIHELENLFADAVVRAQKAGFDGIEICANHHVLLSQFLSPLFNHREDEYGGNDENRARFVIEIIEKIRERVGKDYIVILKINSEDNDPNGITPNGFLTACKLAEKAGIDMIDVTGMRWKEVKESKVVYFDEGKSLAEILKIPILVTGGVKDVNVANEALNKSNIQYIGISRE